MNKNKLKNVLVFPCGSLIGLELHKALSYSSVFKVFGGTSVKDHGSYVYENLITDLPFIDAEDFLPKLNTVIQSYEIDFIYPTNDKAMLLFSKWVKENKIHIAKVMTSPYETCRIAYSKKETYELFDGIIPTPRVYLSSQEVDKYPVFLKPDIGTGGRGTHIVNSKKEVDFYLSIDPSLLILEYLPGSEYTIDCFTDRKGNLRYAQGKIKSRYINNKFYGHAEKVKDERFFLLAGKINQTLEFRGAWFFQIKENEDGELVLLEIAARVGGSTSYQWMNGVNLPLLSLYDAHGKKIYFKENEYGLEMDRTFWHYRYAINYEFNHVYLSFDNSLIFAAELNYKLLALLYKFRSQGKTISLLISSSKITDGLYREELDEHLIPIKLFDNIIEVPDETAKSKLIQNQGSILIDTSFFDRNEVALNSKIPVFDISQAIELFLE